MQLDFHKKMKQKQENLLSKHERNSTDGPDEIKHKRDNHPGIA